MPLGERSGDLSESKYCGVETDFDDDISRILEFNMSSGGFDFVVSPLTDPTYRPCQIQYDKNGASVPPFVGSDLTMSPSQWSSHVVGKISSWIDLDSEDDILREDSEYILKTEIDWASHLSLQACLLPTPKSSSCSNYAKCVNQILQNLNNMQLWLRIPLEKSEDDIEDVDSVVSTGQGDFWEQWNLFRLLCEQHSQLSIALVVSATLPCPNSIGRWFGEPVRAAIIDTKGFMTNARGYPCLSKRHQKLIMGFFDHSVQVVISGKDVHNVAVGNSAPVSNPDDNIGDHPIEGKEVGFGDENGKDESLDDCNSNEEYWKSRMKALKISDLSSKRHPLRVYLDYVAYLYRKMEPLPEKERFEFGYRDFLQAPLQPLMDNLEAQTYETFEKDSVKYTQYQKAISQVLLERVTDEKASSVVTVLMVMGAGRGPLVRASLQAAEDTGRKLKIYAIEKNPNAVVTLHSLVKLEGWEGIVTIVSCDMRIWEAPEDADILVSELLGSFGDNELSPECLDGAEKFLKKDGVSIPSSYTSFLQPLTASKLHRDIMNRKEAAGFETAYVVKMHNVAMLASPQPVFTFNHPDRSPKKNYQRYKKLIFEFPKDTGSTLVHGFAGYFDATLYKDVHLGIEPCTSTPNMFSWFPIFFPLRTPTYVRPATPLLLDFWRCCGTTKVWYEWCVPSPTPSPIHNSRGRSYWVGL